MFIYNTEISNGLICLCTNNMLSLFADDFYLFSWRETRDRETEEEQAKQMQPNRYTVKTNKKQLNAICGGHSLFCGAPTLLSH